jgi:hypothetical protein
MRAVGVPAGARLWVAIGLTFIVALFAAVPAWTAGPASAPVDHHISTDGDSNHLAAVDHEHIGAAATQGAPDSFGDVMAPRVRTALIAVGVVLAVALLWRLSPQHTPSVGRDPPRTPVVVLTGQDVLARLCIARR